MYNFKTVDGIPIQILEHIAVQKAKYNKNLKVHIGTDAGSREGYLHYYLVVAFRYGSNGAHFVYHKEKIPIFRHGNGKPDVFNKLWKEAELTINFCEYIIENEILSREQISIEMDYNGIKETLSTKLIPATCGWAIGLGYKVITKNENNNLQIAVKAANFLSQS
jgi:predicted RNase H-related nuclease YkuK (DUF458 family)